MNPYKSFVETLGDLVAESVRIRPDLASGSSRSSLPREPTVLLFSPHPDDECLVGALPLRLRRELNLHVINVAVTLGRETQRREARRQELLAACEYLGFDVLDLPRGGPDRLSPETKVKNPDEWKRMLASVAEILVTHQPRIVFIPHQDDWHPTHVATHCLVMDALEEIGARCTLDLVETEYWRPIPKPNLLIESGVEDVSDLVYALSCHKEEVARNPYHIRLPALMVDNVRRYELVVGPGRESPQFTFASVYRVSRWDAGRNVESGSEGVMLSLSDDLASLFDVS